PTTAGITKNKTICNDWLISFFNFCVLCCVKDSVKPGIIAIDKPIAIVTGIIINLCPYILIVANETVVNSPNPPKAIALLNVKESTAWYKGVAIPTMTNGPAYDNNSNIKSLFEI